MSVAKSQDEMGGAALTTLHNYKRPKDWRAGLRRDEARLAPPSEL